MKYPFRSRLQGLSRLQRTILLMLFALTIGSFILGTKLFHDYIAYKNKVDNTVKAHILELSDQAARKIDTILKHTMSTIDKIAEDLTAQRIKKEKIIQVIKETTENNAYFYGTAIAYEPYQYDSKRQLYAPYYVRKGDVLQLIRIETVYDYTKPEQEWYALPVKQERAMWIAPFYGKAGAALMAVYSAPFYGTDPVTGRKNPAGVVSGVITMDEIKRIVQSLDLGKSGFGGLLSNQGLYLYHPVDEYVKRKTSVFDLLKEHNNASLSAAIERGLKGESGIVSGIRSATGRRSWLAYQPIPSAGWSLHLTSLDEISDIDTILRRQLFRLLVVLIVFLLSFSGLLLHIHKAKDKNLWILSVFASILFVSSIGFTWYRALHSNSYLKTGGIAVSDKASLNRYIDVYTAQSARAHEDPPVFIPTGVFIQSAEFASPYNVTVKGYIWQKYSLADTSTKRGFVLPEATDINELTEAYRQVSKGVEVIGWYFSATLRQDFDYAKYPLNRESIWLRLWHKEFNKNTVLVPDLDAYELTIASLLPGVEKHLVLPGWILEKSFFEYRLNSYNTNFGIDNYIGRQNFPELYFNIVIMSDFWCSFISNMIPLIVVSLLLFTILLTASKEPHKVALLGFNVGNTLAVCAGLFFVIIVSHIGLREKIAVEGIIYLEYFYIILYLTILAICVNIFVFVLKEKNTFIQYKDNLWMKLLFWPVILFTLFIVTFRTFY